jgi:hypothetical protein
MFGLFTLRANFIPEERNCLQLFDVEGEGGYRNRQYTFMDSATAYFHDSMDSTIRGICSDDSKIKKINIGADTYNYIDNVIRIVMGNNNQCILYRDGTVDVGGTNYPYPWLKDNWTRIRDTFTPSIYGDRGEQYLLMDNGDLVLIDVYNRTDGIVKLSGVQKILTKNQAHWTDMIVGMLDGSIYQAWIRSDGKNANNTPTGVLKINGLNVDDIQFCTCGDNPITKVFCYKNDLKKIYRFTISDSDPNRLKISGVGAEIKQLTLTDPNEYYISGMSQEFNLILLTNKRLIYCHTSPSRRTYYYNITDPADLTYIFHNLVGGSKIVTPTAYTNIIKMNDESYYITPQVDGGDEDYCVRLLPPEPYTYFNTLKNYLTPIRMAR